MIGRPAAAIAAAALLCACRSEAEAAAPVAAAPASAATPSLVWRDARRVHIICQLTAADGNGPLLERALCERVRAIAGTGAPVPVAIAEAPDPATLGGNAVVLLIHASAQTVGDRRLLLFSVRPFRLSAGDGEALFGTAPRAVPLDDPAAVDAALGASLAQMVPWLPRGETFRPL